MVAPDEALLGWATRAAGPGRTVAEVRGLRDGGSPWLLTLAGSRTLEVVLRLGTAADRDLLATEVAALEHLAGAALPVPRLLAVDLDAAVSPGVLAVLTSRLPGTSRSTRPPSRSRLRALGAAAAAVHRVVVPSAPALPPRDRPIGSVDFGALRRAAPPRPLLVEAERVHTGAAPATRDPVLVHGDLWHGNTLWEGDRLTGVIDWDCAGVGHPGVDVGSLRSDAALVAGPGGPDEVLAGYEAAAGSGVPDVAYWDLTAALATPPTLGWFSAAIRGQGRTDLDRGTLVARRDAFLRSALDRLR